MKKLITILFLLLICNKVYANSVFMPNITVPEVKEKMLQIPQNSPAVDCSLVSETDHLLVFEIQPTNGTRSETAFAVLHCVFGTDVISTPVSKLTISFIKQDDGVMINISVNNILNRGQPDEVTIYDSKTTNEISQGLQESATNRAERFKKSD